MYVIKGPKGTTYAMCSRYEDAVAYLGASKIDNKEYHIEEFTLSEMDEQIIRMAEEYEDGIGEGQVL